jgi:rhodanese-related sulfurtransferase
MNSIFENSKIHSDGIACLLPSEAMASLREGALLVDLRSEVETDIRAFGLERVIYLPHTEFEEKWNNLPKQTPLILAGAVGIWSKHFTKFLMDKGFANVASLAGGIADWEKDGFPMKKGKYQPLNGPCPCMITPRERKQ